MASLKDFMAAYTQVNAEPRNNYVEEERWTPSINSKYDKLVNYIDTKKNAPITFLQILLTISNLNQEYPAPPMETYRPAPLEPEGEYYYTTRNKWAQDLSNEYRKRGIPEEMIKILIAKNAFETGWGKKAQGKNNFGNITTGSKWKGDYAVGNDRDADGNPIKNKFRSYNSMSDFVDDELQFLAHLYDFNPNDDFDTFADKLLGKNRGNRRYAENRAYKEKLRKVYKSV